MRGIYTPVTDIRRKVFTEVARMAYEVNELSDYEQLMRELPFKIIPGEEKSLRSSIFLERAIISERVRLAMGMSLRPLDESVPASEGLEHSVIADKYYEPPLINVIKFACNACPEKVIKVTAMCQGCLAHPCQEVCPKHAISFRNGKSHIDQSLCVKCGRCVNSCPYSAIVKTERPCAAACGMGAIHSDEHGRAEIDYDKCVSCGMCLVNCPFGAIVDKGQIFQLIHAIKKGEKVIAIIAPAFWGQFGEKVTPGQILTAMKQLGFEGLEEVAVGADLCAVEEAEEFMEHVPARQPFMATSCCPAWSVMAKKEFPGFAPYISMTMTPMVLTARLQKRKHPDCKIAFIGPCAAKKLEASRRSVRSEVDFVLTFEELRGMFAAKDIDFSQIPDTEAHYKASAPGVGFAASGGVAKAVEKVIQTKNPDREVKTVYAAGLRACRQMLRVARSGKYDGYLLEGMACPGGCIAGAGTVQPPEKSRRMLEQYEARAALDNPLDSEYMEDIELLYEDPENWDRVSRH
ncbi:4Fe-4S dicluster domain-containing protein [Gemmiger sp.]|uniref:4Fe-4S dicluster domain-containing protein n=1 Tax=Gemmiger sp. TaxID=2049027 RepID=UPI003AF09632